MIVVWGVGRSIGEWGGRLGRVTMAADRLGRIVVPKSVRERYHLVPGTELELNVDVDGFRLKPAGRETTLVRKNGILIHHGKDAVDLDIRSYIEMDRTRRDGDLVAEEPTE